nr:choice-of-anchor L domain-containing protein [Schlegelella koreensis]
MPDASAASAAALVNALLGSNSGIAVVAGSAQYTGAATASGTFANGGTGSSGLGIDRGVVLSSGDARFVGSSAAFPGDVANSTGTFTAGFGNSLTPNMSPGTSLLSSLSPFGTQNASVLSFNFIPNNQRITMSIVFGSEDYNDALNSGFPTDVFGIFVNGVNYALVPGSNTPISASSINCGGPTSGAAPNIGGQNCNLYRDNPPFFDSIITELDGLTTRIDLTIPVNFGAVNSISFAIADAMDSFGDSALLISAGIQAIPEPSTLALGSAAGLLLWLSRRRQARGQSSRGAALS